jgi:hypothetical protein
MGSSSTLIESSRIKTRVETYTDVRERKIDFKPKKSASSNSYPLDDPRPKFFDRACQSGFFKRVKKEDRDGMPYRIDLGLQHKRERRGEIKLFLFF